MSPRKPKVGDDVIIRGTVTGTNGKVIGIGTGTGTGETPKVIYREYLNDDTVTIEVVKEPKEVDPATLKVGDRVRVIRVINTGTSTFDDVVNSTETGYVSLKGLGVFVASIGTWYLLDRAEPEYKKGEVYADALGIEYYYDPDDRWPTLPWAEVQDGARTIADGTWTPVEKKKASR